MIGVKRKSATRNMSGREPGGLRKIVQARYEISVDGTVRTHRDALEIALEAANVLKACNPYSKVAVRDLTTGEMLDFGTFEAASRKRS